MINEVLLIGNAVNNLSNEKAWEDLIKRLKKEVGKLTKDNIEEFPILYENLLLYGKKQKNTSEEYLKEIIAYECSKITPNKIHELIEYLNFQNIITTNYDFVIERNNEYNKTSIIDERKYSIFRRYSYHNQNIWHIHGDIANPNSINLGYEQYSGQLQALRNYVVTGTNYKSNKVPKLPLSKRLKTDELDFNSWVDFFFKKNIHIVGLRLDFVEIDLWWLLTYRAKLKFHKEWNINSKIFYYIPEKHLSGASGKTEFMKNLGIDVIPINKNSFNYYEHVFKIIKNRN